MAREELEDEPEKQIDPPPGFVPSKSSSPFTEMIGPLFDLPDDPDNRRGFRVLEGHINNAGIIHGGMMMSFADTLLARAVGNSGAGPAVTLHMTTDFIGPAHLGNWVEGSAKIIRQTRTLVFVEGEIRTRKRLLMTAKGVFRRLSRRHGRDG
ncbi:MAG: PaaI family thioesterase [Rhodospirillaceae bacterium]|jgi:uncharacterized protein (TIGR00369 family)|nr:PaaI family thioesterase [Rhodospirillaceae bacterium]MBT5193157.1 PaaI family thioesterase [Rhodospirillaceae bacterium]MBT6431252.1 PaaI family thioesterase [Rhodospirillaceae bacterium]MBT7757794.1 PaaI family thioesterase [Rhodospirillaceae bacterium]